MSDSTSSYWISVYWLRNDSLSDSRCSTYWSLWSYDSNSSDSFGFTWLFWNSIELFVICEAERFRLKQTLMTDQKRHWGLVFWNTYWRQTKSLSERAAYMITFIIYTSYIALNYLWTVLIWESGESSDNPEESLVFFEYISFLSIFFSIFS